LKNPSEPANPTRSHITQIGATGQRDNRTTDIKLTQALAGARSADADADVMQDDDANGAPLTKTTTNDRSVTKQKADRALKKSKIAKRKAAPKPSNAMRFGGGVKKKTRKGGK
jgi:hypothetical protein